MYVTLGNIQANLNTLSNTEKTLASVTTNNDITIDNYEITTSEAQTDSVTISSSALSLYSESASKDE